MRFSLLALIVWGSLAIPAEAGLFCHRKGTPPPGRARAIENSFERAGNPLTISHHAAPTRTPEYVGYYVGGGSSFTGGPRRVEEGTWGRDYEGIHLPRRIGLGWNHGRLYQGGTGHYATDGPILP